MGKLDRDRIFNGMCLDMSREMNLSHGTPCNPAKQQYFYGLPYIPRVNYSLHLSWLSRIVKTFNAREMRDLSGDL